MLDAKYQVGANDIAIVGMALRVPGARNLDEFWSNLRNGVEGVRSLSQEELMANGEDPGRLHDPRYVPRAADLPDMELFDAEFFGLSPKEAAIMDPQHRQFLECAWEALENAGKVPSASSAPVGVFAGCGMGTYFYFNVCSNRSLVDEVGMFLLRHTGNDKDFLSTRASYLFDLRGPSVNVQTACSTSLVAVHYAAQSLLSGESDMVIAGGVTIELPHRRGYVFNPGEILSPDGHCRPFDHRAAGTVFGSGTGVVVLRRLDDALRDGDIIHAVIKGTAINNDGGSKSGYLAPSVDGQAEAIVEAQAIADVSADSIGYVECHGTGTYLGDPIEIEALSKAFRQSTDRTGFCYVGSVKSNIGHLDTAAGVVGLIKAALAVKHGEIPPTLGFERPNPSIDFANSPFKVVDRLLSWPAHNGPRRAAVNSLGVGGTNAHAVVEEAPQRYRTADSAATDEAGADPLLLLLSARNRKALDAAADRLKDWLGANPDVPLQDVAYTLFKGRKRFNEWMVLPVRGRQTALDALTDRDAHAMFQTSLEKASGCVFMFPGGGVQYPGMAKQLATREPIFRAAVEEGLSYLPEAVGAEIRTAWLDDTCADAANHFLRPSLQLPAILIVEVALAHLWSARGLQPRAMIGHSMGEYAAACVSGVMSFRDAVCLVRRRGELFETVPLSGMLSVSLDERSLMELLPASLDLACVNAPSLCVVSGSNRDLEAFRQELADKGVEATRIPIDIAAHSRLLDDVLDPFKAFVAGLVLSPPKIPIISNLTGAPLTAGEATDPAYWTDHLRKTVRFSDGLAAIAGDPSLVFVEVGPGRVLSSLAKGQGTIAAGRIINSLPHASAGVDDRDHFMAAVGRAFAIGLDVDLGALVEQSSAQRIALPSYPFQHKRYFIEPSKDLDNRGRRPVLTKQTDLDTWGYRPAWTRSWPDYHSGAEDQPSTWLVFVDDDGLGATLVARLRTKGHRVVTVHRGDNFRSRGDDAYVLCAELGKQGYVALLGDLQQRDALPSRIVHMWLADEKEHVRPGSNSVHQHEEQGFYSLTHLVQAWADLSLERELSITVVTSGMQQVNEDDAPDPDKALVLGPALVAPKELAGLSIKVVDLDLRIEHPGATAGRLSSIGRRGQVSDEAGRRRWAVLEELWEEVHSRPASEVVAWRNNRRFRHGYDRLPLLPGAPGAAVFRHKGVYLFAGGLSEIALALAAELAEKYTAKLVIIARPVLQSRDEWHLVNRTLIRPRVRRAMVAVEQLEDKGAEVLYLSADVTNSEQMAEAIATARARFGEIHGVFHSAGALDDGLLQTKDHHDIERVLAPKVAGLRVLDGVLKTIDIDFLALFSSTSTDIARAGQTDYLAGNAYLNSYAQAARRKGRRVISIHWGVWNEVGLAARAVGARTTKASDGSHSAAGPFFERWIECQESNLWLEVSLSTRSHWILDEHRMLSGSAVFPGAAYLEMLVQAHQEYGLGQDVRIKNLSFIRPLVVEDDRPRLLRLRLEPRNGGFDACIGSKEPGEGDDRLVIHAKASISANARIDIARLDLDTLRGALPARSSATGNETLPSFQQDRLRFGERWSILRTKAVGDVQAIADLRLSTAFAGDLSLYKMHPALLDIATGFALELVLSDDDGRSLWVPTNYGEVVIRKPLPATIVSWARIADSSDLGDGFAAFDVTITDPAGEVLVEIKRFVMHRMEKALEQMTGQSRPAETSPGSEQAAMSPALQRLSLQVANGIRPAEGLEALERALVTSLPEVIVSSIDLETLAHFVDEPINRTEGVGDGFERPDLENDYVAPTNRIEETLAEHWQKLIGVERIGVNDNFFDLGGHSLIAVRLFRTIKNEFGADLPISTLFERPTIALCASKIAELVDVTAARPEDEIPVSGTAAAGDSIHLVPMAPGPSASQSATPLFICAGMFGNILNLRHVALAIGRDRPVYGLQARGLYGEQEPHRKFEDMARDYIDAIKAVQPEGPYLLAGYSGGGITALEMARQLVGNGDVVAHLALFDTPLPRQPALSISDRVRMKLQDIRRHKVSYLSKWWRDHQVVMAGKRMKNSALASVHESENFNSVKLEMAFREAASVYEVKPYSGPVTLFRPKLDVFYRLPGGRLLQEGRNILLADNGWGQAVSRLLVFEVPGDHDSMMLDPFVRVLADRLRRLLLDACERSQHDQDSQHETKPLPSHSRMLEAAQ